MKTMNGLYKSILFFILLFILGCDNNDDGPDKYDMTYALILNGDENVTSMSLRTETYFPEENTTEWIGYAKRKRYVDDEEYFLNAYDTMSIQPSLQVYENCTRYIFIRLRFNEGTDNEKYRDYDLGVDTIYSSEDAAFVFKWPVDSTKYDYVEKKIE